MFIDCLILPFFDNSTQLNSRIVHSKMYQMNVLARQLYSVLCIVQVQPHFFEGTEERKSFIARGRERERSVRDRGRFFVFFFLF
jgi:hypothetical protein